MMTILCSAIALSSLPTWTPQDSLRRFGLDGLSSSSHTVGANDRALSVLIRIRPNSYPSDYDLRQESSVGLRNASTRGFGNTPFAKNGWMQAGGQSAFALAIVDKRHVQVSLSLNPRQLGSQGGPRLTSEEMHGMVDRLFRETAARLTGSQLRPDGNTTVGAVSFPTMQHAESGVEYVRLAAFASAAQASVTEELSNLQIHIKRGTRMYTFAWGTPHVKTANGWESIPGEVAFRDNHLWIPVATARKFLGN